MKQFLLLAIIAFMSSCYSYKSFVTVNSRTDVPDGSTEFIIAAPIAEIKDSLRSHFIAFDMHDQALETQEVLLDEGTRARYNIYTLDSTLVKVVPYWGYTDKVKQETAVWVGYNAASSMSNEMTRVIYKHDAGRPKSVFDYGVQILSRANQPNVTFRKG